MIDIPPAESGDGRLRIRTEEELCQQMTGLRLLAGVLSQTLEDWFLSGGTLLGAYRDGDFIPWDWDVELTVLTEEARPKTREILRRMKRLGFGLVKVDFSRKNYKIVLKAYGTTYEILGRKIAGHNRVRLMTKIPKHFFEKRDFINLRGAPFPTPFPIEGFLEQLYGDWHQAKRTLNKKEYLSEASLLQGQGRVAEAFHSRLNSLIVFVLRLK